MDNFKPIIDDSEKMKFIQEIRDLKDLKKVSCQYIADKTEENNEKVSLSTVKNVFDAKKNHNYDYNNTLIPIYNALVDRNDNDDPIIKILNTRLEIKKETIRQLESRLELKDLKHKDREEFYMQQIEFLQAQIKFKDEQIKHHNESIDRKDAVILELYSILIGTKKIEDVFT